MNRNGSFVVLPELPPKHGEQNRRAPLVSWRTLVHPRFTENGPGHSLDRSRGFIVAERHQRENASKDAIHRYLQRTSLFFGRFTRELIGEAFIRVRDQNLFSGFTG
jgi:hypothetical protein